MRIASGGRCVLPHRAGERFSIPFSCGRAVSGGSLPDGVCGNQDCFPESPADFSASFPDCPFQSAAFVPQGKDSAFMREISGGARGMRLVDRIPQNTIWDQRKRFRETPGWSRFFCTDLFRSFRFGHAVSGVFRADCWTVKLSGGQFVSRRLFFYVAK